MGLRFKVQGSGFEVQGSGFRVQGSGFRKIRNEELGMKVAASPRSFDSGRSCSDIRYLTYDVSRRSG